MGKIVSRLMVLLLVIQIIVPVLFVTAMKLDKQPAEFTILDLSIKESSDDSIIQLVAEKMTAEITLNIEKNKEQNEELILTISNNFLLVSKNESELLSTSGKLLGTYKVEEEKVILSLVEGALLENASLQFEGSYTGPVNAQDQLVITGGIQEFNKAIFLKKEEASENEKEEEVTDVGLNKDKNSSTIDSSGIASSNEDLSFVENEKEEAVANDESNKGKNSSTIDSSSIISSNKDLLSVEDKSNKDKNSSNESVNKLVVSKKENTSKERRIDRKVSSKEKGLPQNIRTYFNESEDSSILIKGEVTFRDRVDKATEKITLTSIATTTFEWVIPGYVSVQIKNNDIFEFNLPEELKLTQTITRDLADTNGIVYGQFTAAPSGKVVITFNNEAASHPGGIKGDIWFDSELNEAKIKEAGPIKIDLPVQEQRITEFIIKTNFKKTIEKSGIISNSLNPSKATWTIDFNKGLDKRINTKIIEILPTGNEYVSAKVYKLVVNLKGEVIRFEELTEGFSIDSAGNVSFEGVIENAFRIVYETKILDSIKEDAGNSIDLVNKAELTSDESAGSLSAEATVRANFGKMLTKVKTDYIPETQVFSWAVRYNYGVKTIEKAEATLTDTMDDRLEVDESTILLQKVEPISETTEKKPVNLVIGIDYEIIKNGNGFKVNFLKDINYAVKLTYKTKVKAGVIIDSESSKGELGNVKNTITTKEIIKSESSGTLVQQGIIKSRTGIDYATKLISWKMDVNQNRYQMSNATFSDTFMNEGLTLNEDSFEIKDTTNTINKTLLRNIDYVLTLKADKKGFDIKLIGAYEMGMASPLTITYKTPYVRNDLISSTTIFKNAVTLNWLDNNGRMRVNSSSAEVNPKNETKNNGFKNGSYDAIHKRISWKVGVNYNGEVIQAGAEITDVINGNQEYLANEEYKARLYRYTIDTTGNVIKREEVTSAEPIKSIELNGKRTLIAKLPNEAIGTTNAYVLEFNTSLVGQVIETQNKYTNVAKFINKDSPNRLYTGTVSIKNGGDLATKSGKQNITDGIFIDWTVPINKSQSTITDALIVDIPSKNQILVLDSLNIYPLIVEVNGDYTKSTTSLIKDSDYTLDVTTDNLTGQQEITIKFIGDFETITTAYEMNYSTLLNLDKNDNTVTNKVVFSGENKVAVEKEVLESIQAQFSSGGGSVSGEKGTITVKKSGSDGKLLEGTKFELWNAAKTVIVRTGTINDTGILTFGNLIYSDYYLKEVSALPGYTVSDELVAGKKVTVNSITSNSLLDIDVPLTNDLSKVVIEKSNGETTLLKDAEFKLLIKTESGYDVIDEYKSIKTGTNGEITLEGLLPGNYRLNELKAPVGYLLNTDPIDFIVTKKGIQVPTVSVKAINYQGSVQLIKANKAGEKLSGAEFSVLNKAGEAIQTELISNSDGVVIANNLAPGEYSFVETKAAVGYLINTTPVNFTIGNEAAGEPKAVIVGELLNFKGTVELEKKDKNGELLSGAVFELTGDNGYEASNFTTKDGKITVDNLKPGEYEFKEITAPIGFIKNTTAVPFEVKASETGEPAVIKTTSVNYKGSVEFEKINEVGKGLGEAEFSILDSKKQLIQDKLVSDIDGLVKINELAPGVYTFVETKAPKGYLINTAPIEFTIADQIAGEPPAVVVGEFKNYKGTAQLKKIDSKNKVLQGAIFSILNEVGDTVQSGLISDKEGLVNAENLIPGNYTFVETKAPTEYIINTTPIKFVIANEAVNKPALVEAGTSINYQGIVQLKNVDGKGKQLQGATFSIVNTKGDTVLADLVSGKDGLIIVDELAPGDYRFIETGAVPGYILNDKESNFTIVAEEAGKPNAVLVGDFANYQGSVELTKTDNKETLLSGAVFELTGDNGYEATNFTTKDDKITVNNLKPGKYEFKEVTAPVGFIINTTVLPFIVEAVQNEGPKLISVSTINYKGSAQLMKRDTDGKELAGAEFIVKNEADKQVGEKIISDENGLVKATELVPGNYTFVEVKAPSGFVTNNKPLAFTIEAASLGQPEVVIVDDLTNYKGTVQLLKTDANDKELEGAEFSIFDKDNDLIQDKLMSDSKGMVRAGNLAPGKYTFVETSAAVGFILNTTPIEFTITNKAADKPDTVDAGNVINYKGSAQLTKVDEEGKGLEGATFSIINTKGDTVLADLMSDMDGLVKAEELVPGDYRFIETGAVPGYILNDKESNFTIVAEEAGKPKAVLVGDFANYQGSVELTKTDKKDTLLSGAVFELTGDNGHEATNFTTKDGKITVDNLKPGKYEFKEISAPTGFIINTKIIPFTVEAVQNEKPRLIDVSSINYKAEAQLMKINASGNGLKGAEFSVTNMDGKTIQTGLVSDETGLVKAEGLAPGEYLFVETKAPKGYIKNTLSMKFIVMDSLLEEPKVIKVGNLTNYQGSVVLTKTDSIKEQVLLGGAVFDLTDKDGRILQADLKTDGNGQISLSGLEPGEYAFSETKAPIGYVLAKKPIVFTIVAEHEGKPEMVAMTVKNDRLIVNEDPKGNLPQTGEDQTYLYAFAGSLLMTGSGLYLVNMQNKKRKNKEQE
ncbi:SpaA isopeptide-forming pilin-related protein [Carnobacterium sp. TMP28]|uniref:SpaA isopeptide-forming pilin-related protein n=1 Tax=Carnobacterium sp. TMP28 TaxID=3397060 RepID=UPI0039E119DF